MQEDSQGFIVAAYIWTMGSVMMEINKSSVQIQELFRKYLLMNSMCVPG